MRAYRVNLRFSEYELTELKAKAGNMRLATYCKSVALSKQQKRKAVKRTCYSHLPPELVRQLAGIGNNLNQITRLAHIAKKTDELDIIALTLSVEAIRQEIRELVKANDLQNV